MYKFLRRGSASATKSLFSTTPHSQCSRINYPLIRQSLPQTVRQNTTRLFGTSVKWNQQQSAAVSSEYEEAAAEEELSQQVHAQEPPSDSQINGATMQGPVTKFKDLATQGLVCQTVVDTITNDMRLETMTQVQSLTLNESLKGTDILAQARTGTGKTLAFLIPILQNIINVDPQLEKRARIGRSENAADIRALIISPTRELAEQIAVEARKVTKDTNIIVQTAVGGTQKSYGLHKMRREGCHVLVGTPGRLNDILSDPYSQVRAPNLSALVLDEADRLLDQGFATEIEAIQRLLPNRRDRDRQTLLYSATVPQGVMQVVRKTMKRDFQFVRTVQEGEQQTHEKVPQKSVYVGGFENYMPTLVELCSREMAVKDGSNDSIVRPFKAIVYFGATADVSLASTLFENLRRSGQNIFAQNPFYPTRIIEMHARLSQGQRTRAAENFRNAKSAIMLSSDVTARGMDFPNVTHVIQIGLPPSQEQYVHRLGRTARGDKTGEGWILVSNLEARELGHRLPEMPLKPDKTLETANVDMKKDAQLPERTANILTEVQNATKKVPHEMKVASYLAGLGIHQGLHNKQGLVAAMNDRALYGWGMEEPPSVGVNLATKLGLSRIPGLNIGNSGPQRAREDSGSSFGGGSRDIGRGWRDRGGFAGGRSSFGGGDRYERGGDRHDRDGDRYDRGGDRYDRGGFGQSSSGRGDTSRYKRY